MVEQPSHHFKVVCRRSLYKVPQKRHLVVMNHLIAVVVDSPLKCPQIAKTLLDMSTKPHIVRALGAHGSRTQHLHSLKTPKLYICFVRSSVQIWTGSSGVSMRQFTRQIHGPDGRAPETTNTTPPFHLKWPFTFVSHLKASNGFKPVTTRNWTEGFSPWGYPIFDHHTLDGLWTGTRDGDQAALNLSGRFPQGECIPHPRAMGLVNLTQSGGSESEW